MMKAVARDRVWTHISWQKTDKKESFPEFFDVFWKAILKISSETFPAVCNQSYCESRVKTFLRHTDERMKRNENANLDE